MEREKVLVVDDEQEIADLISLYLENEGYQVFKFYDAAGALHHHDGVYAERAY